MPASSMSASTASMAGRFAWMSLRIASRRSRAEYRRAMANPGGRRRIVRVGAAAVAMVLVAEAAVWLLRPGERPIQPAPVSESDYFTPAQIDRGRTYSDGQLWLFVAALGAQGAVLITLALGRPAAARRGLERLEARPLLGAAAVGAGLSVALGVAALSGGIAAPPRAGGHGLSPPAVGPWVGGNWEGGPVGAGVGRA